MPSATDAFAVPLTARFSDHPKSPDPVVPGQLSTFGHPPASIRSWPGLPTSRAPDAPVPVAREYSRQISSHRVPVASTTVMPDNNPIEQDRHGIKGRYQTMRGLKDSSTRFELLSKVRDELPPPPFKS